MPLTLPVIARFRAETPALMLQAAEARLIEAEALSKAEQWDGAVYLAGYVAEMLLKVAYCQLDPTFPVTGTVDYIFGPAKTVWNSLVPVSQLPYQHKHSLLFWEAVLDEHRRILGVAPAEWGLRLTTSRNLLTVRLNWRVDLRYQGPLLVESEARAVCEAARWLFDYKESFGVSSYTHLME